MKSQTDKEQFIMMRASGMSFSTIASEINVSKPTLIKWAREFEVEIRNQKSLEVDELRSKYMETKSAKAKRLSNFIEQMADELRKRDLSQVPTEKLVALLDQSRVQLDAELQVKFSEEVDMISDMLASKKIKTWIA